MRVFISSTPAELEPHQAAACDVAHDLGLRPLPAPGSEDRAGDAARVARAFGDARAAQPAAPLVPELQVVLVHLLEQAGKSGRDGARIVEVPKEPGELIEQALEEHLKRALDAAFPGGTKEARLGRTRALLALRELAGAQGRREEGLPPLPQRTGLLGEGRIPRLGATEGSQAVLQHVHRRLTLAQQREQLTRVAVFLRRCRAQLHAPAATNASKTIATMVTLTFRCRSTCRRLRHAAHQARLSSSHSSTSALAPMRRMCRRGNLVPPRCRRDEEVCACSSSERWSAVLSATKRRRARSSASTTSLPPSSSTMRTTTSAMRSWAST